MGYQGDKNNNSNANKKIKEGKEKQYLRDLLCMAKYIFEDSLDICDKNCTRELAHYGADKQEAEKSKSQVAITNVITYIFAISSLLSIVSIIVN